MAHTIVFDVNETLSDIGGMEAHFAAAGAAPYLARTWFASVLRDGFALIAGAAAPFADVARATARMMLGNSLDDPDIAIESIMNGFLTLDTHPDVVPGVIRLTERGHRLVTLSNGSTAVAERLLSGAGVRDAFEHLLSVEDAGAWKPDARAYEYAARTLGREVGDLLLVAVHPWDLDGARRAGLHTAWIDRSAAAWPDVFADPDYRARDLLDLADVLERSP